METLGDYSINFGNNFIKYTIQNNIIKEWGKLSNQAISCLDNLHIDIMSGKLPTNSYNALGLYSYIADREDFEEEQFEGFISLEKYPDRTRRILSYLYEYYYNKFDNITIYVYICDRKSFHKLKNININKCLFF
jgi:hypothetical protein